MVTTNLSSYLPQLVKVTANSIRYYKYRHSDNLLNYVNKLTLLTCRKTINIKKINIKKINIKKINIKKINIKKINIKKINMRNAFKER